MGWAQRAREFDERERKARIEEKYAELVEKDAAGTATESELSELYWLRSKYPALAKRAAEGGRK